VDNFVGKHGIARANARQDWACVSLLQKRADIFSIKSTTWTHGQGV
jgi:hypothetical protein